MAQLPRGLREAAISSIETYNAEIVTIDRILAAEDEKTLALVPMAKDGHNHGIHFAIAEESLIEALQLLADKRRESVRVLSEGLAAEEAAT